MLETKRPTLKGIHESVLRRYAGRTAINFGGNITTYGELDNMSARLAAALVNLGLQPEDRVGLVMSNRPEYTACEIALSRAGLAKVPVNDMLSADDIEYMLHNAKASAVIVGPDFAEIVAERAPRICTVKHVIAIDAATAPDGWHDLETILETRDSGPPDVDVTSEHLAGVFHTGGTTGEPKGVEHTQGNLALNATAHATELDIRQDDRLLLMTPLPHVAGLAMQGGLIQGCTHVITQGFDPARALALIETEDITWTFMVPTMIYQILSRLDEAEYETSSLRTLVYGAAPMKPEQLRDGIEKFGNVFLQIYGQYESPDLITVLPKGEHDVTNRARLKSCGAPAMMCEATVVDEENNELPPGEVGEIVARTAYTTEGYFEQPEKSAETLAEGWLHTGDIGKYDEDGYFYLLDRDSDIIVSGGMNVYSTEVENVIQQHPAVDNVAVVGVPHETWGEAVTAIIVPTKTDLDTDDILKFCDERLADYKKPKSIERVEELPTTPYGKIDKKALREPYWDSEERQIS